MTRAVCVLALLAAGCGDGDRPPPPSAGSDGTATFAPEQVASGHPDNVVALGACEDGDVRQCRVYLERHGNVQPCFVGEQRCVGEAWGDCADAVLVDASDLDDDPASSGDDPASNADDSDDGY
jgi:hypothetical protein